LKRADGVIKRLSRVYGKAKNEEPNKNITEVDKTCIKSDIDEVVSIINYIDKKSLLLSQNKSDNGSSSSSSTVDSSSSFAASQRCMVGGLNQSDISVMWEAARGKHDKQEEAC
jgi:hypothetical protein